MQKTKSYETGDSEDSSYVNTKTTSCNDLESRHCFFQQIYFKLWFRKV